MVEKTRGQKARDYAILGVGLPVAVAIDVAVIGGVVYCVLRYGWDDDDADDYWKKRK